MNNKGLIAAIFLLLIGIVALGGCGPSDQKTVTQQATAQARAEEQAKTEAAQKVGFYRRPVYMLAPASWAIKNCEEEDGVPANLWGNQERVETTDSVSPGGQTLTIVGKHEDGATETLRFFLKRTDCMKVALISNHATDAKLDAQPLRGGPPTQIREEPEASALQKLQREPLTPGTTSHSGALSAASSTPQTPMTESSPTPPQDLPPSQPTSPLLVKYLPWTLDVDGYKPDECEVTDLARSFREARGWASENTVTTS